MLPPGRFFAHWLKSVLCCWRLFSDLYLLRQSRTSVVGASAQSAAKMSSCVGPGFCSTPPMRRSASRHWRLMLPATVMEISAVMAAGLVITVIFEAAEVWGWCPVVLQWPWHIRVRMMISSSRYSFQGPLSFQEGCWCSGVISSRVGFTGDGGGRIFLILPAAHVPVTALCCSNDMPMVILSPEMWRSKGYTGIPSIKIRWSYDHHLTVKPLYSTIVGVHEMRSCYRRIVVK